MVIFADHACIEQTNENAAWYYPTPKDAAAEIAGRVAFWKGVKVTA